MRKDGYRFPDEKEGYVTAWVMREHDEIGNVMLVGGDEVRLSNMVLVFCSICLLTRLRRVVFPSTVYLE